MIRQTIRSLRRSLKFSKNSKKPLETVELPEGCTPVESSMDENAPSTSLEAPDDSREFEMNEIPDEIIVHILRFLFGPDLMRCQQLSQRFKLLIEKYRLFDHKLIEIRLSARCFPIRSNMIEVTIKTTRSITCFVSIDCVSKNAQSWADNDNYYEEGEEPIVDRFYRRVCLPRTGEEFLRRILPLARIQECVMRRESDMLTRFFELACELRCPIECLILRSVGDVQRAVDLLRSNNFHYKPIAVLHLSPHFIEFSNSEWEILQELASIIKFRIIHVPFQLLLLLLQGIIENWLKGIIRNSFEFECAEQNDYRFASSGELMRPFFNRSDIIFDGISQQEIRKMEYNSDLPNSFRIVKTSDQSFINFTRMRCNMKIFVVTFGES